MKGEARPHYKHIVIVLLFVLGIFIALWATSGLLFNDYLVYKLSTQESVSGLVVDAPVEYKGVEVGKVKSIKLVNSQWIDILLNIKKDSPITNGTVATITARGLTPRGFTGFVYITLKNDGKDLLPLVAQKGQLYPEIPVAPSTSLSLDTTLVQMGKNVQYFTELFKNILDGATINSIKELLSDLKKVTSVLATNNQKLNGILINFEKASYHIEPFLKSGQNVMGQLSKQTLPEVHHMFSDLRPFLKSGHDMMSLLETQTLPTTLHTFTQLDELSRSFSDLLNEIKRDPSILIRGTTPRLPGPGEENANE